MAKRFNFRLQPVLKLRTHKVDEAKNALKIAANLRYSKELEIDNKENYFNKLLKSHLGSVKASEIQTVHFHKTQVRDEIKIMEKEKVKLLEIESVRRSKLSEAMKDEKILLKLKDKQITAHKDEIEKEEVITLDEIARHSFGKADILKI
jgi:flagellar export protein FliJ